MNRLLLERYDRRVPRYTSYPTAPHFQPGVNADTYRRWLSKIDATTALSLYFHVPFCKEMCWYCGCHTKIVSRYQPVGDYASVMADEVALTAAEIPVAAPVTHIHWGGGTPTILSSEDFIRLMGRVRQSFDLAPDAEIAVEMDPRTVTADRVAALAATGVNRASLGVQDLNEHVQKAIHRIQPYNMTADVVRLLRDAGINGLNFDLMYGLPGQTIADVERTVDLAAQLRPDRVAVFGYAHVPWMKTHQKMIAEGDLPGTVERFEQAEAAAARLVGHGYRRIGLDHFARAEDEMSLALEAGRLRRNFQGYTTDRAKALIGFGASSIGALPAGYVQNAVPLRQYAEAVTDGRLPIAKGIALKGEDRMRRDIIEQLMCYLKVNLDAVAKSYGRDARGFAAELAELAPMAQDGLVEIDGAHLTIPERGRPLMRTVCAAFDQYLAAGTARHSKAV